MRSNAVVNYNVDDPFGRRDGRRWRLYLRSVPCYDLVVVVREVNVAEAYARGARGVLRLYRSADEEAHAPRPLTAVDRAKWTDGVIFVGTWMPERGPLLASLLEAGVPLSIHGDGWRKAAEWPVLQPSWRGPALYGEDYVKAIRHARVCLGLLSKGNRDLHTQRSMEIPFAGGLLCAERTSEHRRALCGGRGSGLLGGPPGVCGALPGAPWLTIPGADGSRSRGGDAPSRTRT